MGLIQQWIESLASFTNRRMQALATEIATRSQPAVWQRVAPVAITMRSSEARGYIRARAATVIHSQVDAIAAQAGLANQRDELIRLATSEVLRLTIRQWVQARPGQTVTLPQRHAA